MVEETKAIRVTYWLGTQQLEGVAHTYLGARRIAGRNRNAYQARFYDATSHEELFDDGLGLCTAAQVYVVTGKKQRH